MEKRIFITGAGGGLGREVVRQAAQQGFHVTACARNARGIDRIMRDALALGEGCGHVDVMVLDVDDIDHMPEETARALERADILINNAADGADLFEDSSTIFSLDEAQLWSVFYTNFEGARRLMTLAVPHMLKRGWGRVVNLSSQRSRLTEFVGEGATPIYRLSKLLINGMTVAAAHETQGSGVLINALCPGWCATPMGGPQAPESPVEGGRRILHVATLPDNGPTGQLFAFDHPVSF